MTAVCSILVVVLLSGGCSVAGQRIDLGAQPPSSAPAPTGQPWPGLKHSTPVWVDVPDIDAHSSLVPLGLNEDRTVALPSVHQPEQAGWYRYGPSPGEPGPAVILGHVNGDGKDGIFARLRELRPGKEIRVGRADGTVARFTVTRMAQVSKNHFPAAQVYGNTADPELRLITCGGTFDETAHSYRDNIIAYARFIGAAEDHR
ncbi:class F sortase [Sciscionella sediminilitoris]|uniref:class F sortase n=1 Tax=Sciscionella sediminilitoris TaxID=1445613 RepID=UPI0005608E12|nr:class F sortase [Sciscionella sp. SE31]